MNRKLMQNAIHDNNGSSNQKSSHREVIVINTTNYTGNNKYVYNFGSAVTLKNSTLSLQQLSMYNSTFNITQSLGNNTYTVNFPVGGTSTNLITKTYTIPDGLYQVTDLNNLMQYNALKDAMYVINNNGQNVFFWSFQVNAIQYKIQIDLYTIPTSAQATTLKYTLPTFELGQNDWNWSSGSNIKAPQLELCEGLSTLLGFTKTSFPERNVLSSVNKTYLSNTYPKMSPVFCYVLCCNLLCSKFTNPPNIFYQVPLTVPYGQLINIESSVEQKLPISDGVYQNIQLFFYDQNFNTLVLNDPEILITLVIEENN